MDLLRNSGQVADAPTGAIVVRGLEQHYGERQVLWGVDLVVEQGEIVALLGPNGAGKTTTVEVLEGYREPTAGHVRVLGFDPRSQPVPLRQRTGVVLQESGFPHHLRVGELIDAWRAYYPSPRSRAELLALVELDDDEATLVRRLSGGQRRRLDFALALAGDPELIFLDEPTTGFDPEARRRCWSSIENLRMLGKTILLTTHYLEEAERLADRIAVLHHGRIVAVGTARELARQAGAPTRVTFTPEGLDVEDRELPGVGRLQQRGTSLTAFCDDAWSTLAALVAWAADRDIGGLDHLAVEPPRLEEAYLRLVGTEESVLP